ncbi:MAG: Uma2 family endonuclease [Thermosynechococcaceae cyanobacterium]
MVTAIQAKSEVSQKIVLQGISWGTYEALVRELESQPGKRMTYDNGILEIFMPLPPHEKNKKYLARFVELVTEELGIEICSLGSSTWSRKDLAKGVEADECYYIQHEAAVRNKMRIDLTVEPPPDLAIEVDVTSLSLPRLPIYGALGVPEVWRFDGEQIVLLSWAEGRYRAMDRSLALPIVTVEGLQVWLKKAQEMGETSWAKAVRGWAKVEAEKRMASVMDSDELS